MRIKDKTTFLTVSALLSVLGILIPAVQPLRIVVEPATYTLASHVPIFIALFISPMTAVLVAFATALGFFIEGFSLVVVLRAATHVIWAFLGATLVQNNDHLFDSAKNSFMFSVMIGLVHAAAEMMVVIPFFIANRMAPGFYSHGFIESIVIMIGLGTLLHSMVDFFIAVLIWKPLSKVVQAMKADKIPAEMP